MACKASDERSFGAISYSFTDLDDLEVGVTQVSLGKFHPYFSERVDRGDTYLGCKPRREVRAAHADLCRQRFDRPWLERMFFNEQLGTGNWILQVPTK